MNLNIPFHEVLIQEMAYILEGHILDRLYDDAACIIGWYFNSHCVKCPMDRQCSYKTAIYRDLIWRLGHGKLQFSYDDLYKSFVNAVEREETK